MSINVRRAPRSVPPDPRVRRAYFDCRYGQLHTHYAIPGGGGFDEATPVLCIPGSPGSGRFFAPLLPALGRDRTIYAPDLPGCGESDPPSTRAGSGEMAQALFDFLDAMRLRRVDLMAHDGGVPIALAMIEMRPAAIARVVLSPANETGHNEARNLRQPTLVTDLLPLREAPEIDRQTAQLRDFLGSA